MLLNVENLSISIGAHPIVRDLSFSVDYGQSVGIVGESGCGKSITALAIMGLLEYTQITVTDGAVCFNGRNLLDLSVRERRALMGSQMAMIFQEPMSSLNPVYGVGEQIVEMIRQHEKVSAKSARARARTLLKMVHVPDPAGRFHSYPHQLSGGMRQRVMIAIALACSPDLLIADEPTTALDVTVQSQILALLRELQSETGMAMILVSHDLAVIAENCQTVAVMYRGGIVEYAPTTALFASARHRYTVALMKLIPNARAPVVKLAAIPGRVPAAGETISGCAFHPRCDRTDEICKQHSPEARGENGHIVRCHHPHGERR